MITYYTFGQLVYNKVTYTKDLIILLSSENEKILYPWWRKEGHFLQEEDLKEVFAFRPTYLIVGRGASGVMKISKEVRERAKREGIILEDYLTEDAVKRFNSLLSKGLPLAGAFHLTC
ncbi:MAG: MTH938/NDUFAF3 family protein [Thermodesulfobacteriaceae bacterium]|nr:MTH938/NDUFAF3 family protein [Thermodesulfobacteriaceae bacterium]